jgi:hypothetical protein
MVDLGRPQIGHRRGTHDHRRSIERIEEAEAQRLLKDSGGWVAGLTLMLTATEVAMPFSVISLLRFSSACLPHWRGEGQDVSSTNSRSMPRFSGTKERGGERDQLQIRSDGAMRASAQTEAIDGANLYVGLPRLLAGFGYSNRRRSTSISSRRVIGRSIDPQGISGWHLRYLPRISDIR